jgi:outer membrane immunogenic protein
MRRYLIAGVLAATIVPQIAHAQMAGDAPAPPPAAMSSDTDSGGGASFRGFRIEGNVGWDQFKAFSNKRSKLGYGGTAGFDGMIGDKIVVGAEGSYWRTKGDDLACTSLNGGTICQRSRYELGAAVRVGYLVTPMLMVFGKGGYVNDSQRQSFLSSTGLYYSNGQIVGPGFAAKSGGSIGGYQVGGGVEYSLTKMFYVSGQYVYSRYDNHTSRQRAMFGAGIRFK